MALTPKDFEMRHPNRATPIPARFSGQWIAWDANHRGIVAQGTELAQVRRAAIAAGHDDPILQKIPRGPFVGGA